MRSRFLSRGCGIGMTGGETFILMGGPKAHVAVGMTCSGFLISLLS